MTRLRVEPGRTLTGTLRVPGDKSISHRAVMLAAIAEGNSQLHGLLKGEDVLATIRAFRAMGVVITGLEDECVTVAGAGLRGLRAPSGALDLGNSGTALRLLAGLLAGQPFPSRLCGDASLSRRPMGRVVEPLTAMGAAITGRTPPLQIEPVAGLRAISYTLPVASAQVKSALLLAGLYARGQTCVVESTPTRDHTERLLAGFGYPCEHSGERICVSGGGRLQATRIDVPGDMSSAAFLLVAATITPGSRLCLPHVGVNPTRTGLVTLLRAMGAVIQLSAQHEVCGEPVAELTAQYAPLRGITVPPELVPLAIDELPVLCIAAACADGVTTIRGAEELRHKESDRVSAMAAGLRRLGIQVTEFADGLAITGGELQAGEVDSCTDHRIAMSFCVAGSRAAGPVTVNDCDNVATSFPDFLDLTRAAGLNIDRHD